MSSSRRRPELRLSISKGRDGSQYHRGGTALNITGAGRLSISQGRDAREIPVVGEVFSLDIPFHRTNYFSLINQSVRRGVNWLYSIHPTLINNLVGASALRLVLDVREHGDAGFPLNGALDEFEFFEQIGSENRKLLHRSCSFLEESRWPAPAFQVSGLEHADPEIEQLSPDAWPFGLL